MADIKVRIELNGNAKSEKIGSVKTDNLTFANTSIAPNSSGVFNNMPTRDNTTKGINALTFGQELYFNENGVLDNVDNLGAGLDSEKNKFEIVWGVTNPDKTYNVKITFENAENLKDIVVYGDKESQQFPTRAILDGTTEVFSDDYIWTLQFANESDTHTIEFTHWNRANYNAVLTFIGVMLEYIEIDKRNGLKNIESLSQSTGQPKEIFYGVVPSTGSLEILDVNGELADMVRDRLVSENKTNIQTFANNQLIQDNVIIESNYNLNNKLFSVEISNKLNELENYTIPSMTLTREYYVDSNGESKYMGRMPYSLYDMLSYICNYLPPEFSVDELCSMYIIDNNYKKIQVKEYLSNIIYKGVFIGTGTITTVDSVDVVNRYNSRIYIDKGSALDVLNQICQIAQLNLFKFDDGKFRLISARPIILSNENIISVPLRSQKTSLDRDFITKNKYNNVKLTQYNNTKSSFSLQLGTFNFKDSEGELIKDSLDGVHIVDRSTVYKNFLCFFIDVNSVDGLIYGGVNLDITLSDNEGHSEVLMDSVWYDVDSSKEDFKFEDMQLEWMLKSPHVYNLTPYSTLHSKVLAVSVSLMMKDYEYTNIEINANGSTIVRSPIERLINNNNDIYNFQFDNELISNDLFYKSSNKIIYDVISENIINDYSKGIITAKLSVVCMDYYDINLNKVKDWNKGEVLQVGDIVRIDRNNNGNSAMKYADGSDMYFRVTGRTFRYSGVPLIDLELQEVKVVS